MDVSIKILPGDIEGYCLGLLSEEESKAVAEKARLHPGIKKQVDDFMFSLEQYALLHIAEPPIALKNTLFEALNNLTIEEAKNIDMLPLINKYTDYKNWLHIIQPLLPVKQPEGMFVKHLRNDTVSQILIWTAIDYPDEIHHDEEESLIILKGKCRCHLGNEIIELATGDFLEIPLHVHHNVEVREPVIAVVQRRKVA